MIKVENVSKTFRIPHQKRTSLFENIVGLFSPVKYENLKALDNVSFEINKGEFVGIIGLNGSGKSTLLKILAKVITPDSGNVKINGEVVPFLELGLGFSEELTAKENIYLNGSLLGLTRKEIKKEFNEIIKFAGLENFKDTKLKNFSSGMVLRLAFSTAIRAKGDIFLVDEVLAVGDAEFQQKCFDVFQKFKKEGKTIVFVSHSLNDVEKFCDRVIWLEKGKIKAIGKPKEIISEYISSLK
ncbi:MAG: ABC transporter ATP-binding protein [Candidatus Pacearchaeota archaeon]